MKFPSKISVSSVWTKDGGPKGKDLSQHADKFNSWRFGKFAFHKESSDLIGFDERSRDVKFGKKNESWGKTKSPERDIIIDSAFGISCMYFKKSIGEEMTISCMKLLQNFSWQNNSITKFKFSDKYSRW